VCKLKALKLNPSTSKNKTTTKRGKISEKKVRVIQEVQHLTNKNIRKRTKENGREEISSEEVTMKNFSGPKTQAPT
jgi:hypothetical protein